MKKEISKSIKSAEKISVGKLRPGAIQLNVKPKITAKELHVALDRILEMHGCTNCGMNGLDILFRHPDFISERFADLPGIANAGFNHY